MAQRKTRDLVVHGLGRLKTRLTPRKPEEPAAKEPSVGDLIRKHFPALDKLQVHAAWAPDGWEYRYITYEREPGKLEIVFDNLTPYMAQYIVWRLSRPEAVVSLKGIDERAFVQRLKGLDYEKRQST